ncbi:MAG: hypothetical protein JST23_04255 [Bacteroidetes bacterium]|nr:hypothetical protein [Bacteroidota bacterium]
MSIHRHNYEEYFILYMDNELSSEDRQAVDAFVLANPDLKEELDSLLQYKLEPDAHAIYQDKENLMKFQDEELLLLYNDNELTSEDRLKVELLLNNNPLLQKKQTILLNTKLAPEQIVFPNKASLYRKEEKIRPIHIRWQRIAIAAIFLLAISLTGILLMRNRNTTQGIEIVHTTPAVKHPETPSVPNILEQNKRTINNTEESNIAENNMEAKTKGVIDPDNSVHQAKLTVKEQNIIQSLNGTEHIEIKPEINTTNNITPINAIAIENKTTNNLPTPINNTGINTVVLPPQSSTIAKTSPNPETNINQSIKPNEIITASLNNNSTTSDNVMEEGKNKSSRGLFRKITRALQKGNNVLTGNSDQENKLLVGGFAIHL